MHALPRPCDGYNAKTRVMESAFPVGGREAGRLLDHQTWYEESIIVAGDCPKGIPVSFPARVRAQESILHRGVYSPQS